MIAEATDSSPACPYEAPGLLAAQFGFGQHGPWTATVGHM